MTVPGIIKTTPDDFVVDEIPAYEPGGSGEHLFVRIEKRGRTTHDVVRAVARAMNVEPRDVGVAGLKDKAAVTRQWLSLPAPAKDATIEERARALAIEGVRILDAKRHDNKLRTGHLRGNRFEIVVRGVPADRVPSAIAELERLGREGVPNAFGVQRFGREGDTAERARAWLTGKERAPRDARMRRFHFSALQAAIFNAVLEARVADGTWKVPLAGDILKKEETGGLFVCTDVQADRERAARGEVCPTGPIVGDRMRRPEGEVLALEERIAAPLLEGVDLKRARSLGEGTRRPMRLVVDALSVAEVMERTSKGNQEQGADLAVCFVLPKGAYATTVLANVFDLTDASHPAGDDGIPDDRGTEEE